MDRLLQFLAGFISLPAFILRILSYRSFIERMVPYLERMAAGEPVDVFITFRGRRVRITVDLDDPA